MKLNSSLLLPRNPHEFLPQLGPGSSLKSRFRDFLVGLPILSEEVDGFFAVFRYFLRTQSALGPPGHSRNSRQSRVVSRLLHLLGVHVDVVDLGKLGVDMVGLEEGKSPVIPALQSDSQYIVNLQLPSPATPVQQSPYTAAESGFPWAIGFRGIQLLLGRSTLDSSSHAVGSAKTGGPRFFPCCQL